MMRWETVNDLLKKSLQQLMQTPEFDKFRLVGGTALSLQIGHRMSIDIDLFTDEEYGSINFDIIQNYLENNFTYVDPGFGGIVGMGKSYLVGVDRDNTVKLDVYYSNDKFIYPAVIIDGIRMASVEEIIAMKVDVVLRGGRKKDFWDLHELMPKYSISEMINLHKQRSEYTHDEETILINFTDFTAADEDFDPLCLRGKYWEFIKEDFQSAIDKI
ncbi:hypothetical protein B4N84_06490 [Flavobacterium sp. IR1]|nr:hypothetical protein B4N84_06490 [Flavobacterium sp. IR1]